MIITLPTPAAAPTCNDEGNQAQMTPGDQTVKDPGETDGSAAQSQAQVALAPAPTAPDGDTGNQAAAQTGAVWDQPLPWAGTQDEGRDQSKSTARPMPTPTQAEPSAAPAAPSVQAAVDDTKVDAEAAGEGSSVALWQASVAEQQRGAHERRPVPTGAVAVAGHAVSKWLLGVAVAAGGLLAAVGVAEGLGSHSTAVTAKEKPVPILGPGKGLDEGGTPTQTPTTPAKGRLAAGAGKAAVAAPPAVGLAAADARNAHISAPVAQRRALPPEGDDQVLDSRAEQLPLRTNLRDVPERLLEPRATSASRPPRSSAH